MQVINKSELRLLIRKAIREKLRESREQKMRDAEDESDCRALELAMVRIFKEPRDG
jgi:hypothetical protein